MEPAIKLENPMIDSLDYVEGFIKEEPLDIKEEVEESYIDETANHLLEAESAILESFSQNANFFKIKIEPTEEIHDMNELEVEESTTFRPINSGISYVDDFLTSDEEYEQILSSKGTRKRKRGRKRSRFGRGFRSPRLYKCSECNYVAKFSSVLKTHRVVHSNEKPFKCPHCDYSSKYLSNLNVHKKKKKCNKKKKPFKKQDYIGKEFLSPEDSYSSNIESSHQSDENRYKCTVCENFFPDIGLLRAHENTPECQVRIESEKKCSISEDSKLLCNEETKEDLSLTDTKTFQKTKSKSTTADTKLNKQLLKCDKCEYTAKFISTLKCHEAVHSDERDYVCFKCNFSFKYKSNLDSHLKNKGCANVLKRINKSTKKDSHDSSDVSKLLRLDIDSTKIATQNHNLKKNIKQKNIENICDSDENADKNLTCNKSEVETEEQDLKLLSNEETEDVSLTDAETSQHKNKSKNTTAATQLNKKLFKCDKCEYTTKFLASLKSHEALHSGKRQFVCWKCNFPFKYKSNLATHLKNKSCATVLKRINKLKKKNIQDSSDVAKMLRLDVNSTKIMRTNIKQKNAENFCDSNENVDENLTYNKSEVEKEEEQRLKPNEDRRVSENESKNTTTATKLIKKLFKCDECEYTTKFTASLKSHEALHSGERQYVCFKCNFPFKYKNNLAKHLKNKGGCARVLKRINKLKKKNIHDSSDVAKLLGLNVNSTKTVTHNFTKTVTHNHNLRKNIKRHNIKNIWESDENADENLTYNKSKIETGEEQRLKPNEEKRVSQNESKTEENIHQENKNANEFANKKTADEIFPTTNFENKENANLVSHLEEGGHSSNHHNLRRKINQQKIKKIDDSNENVDENLICNKSEVMSEEAQGFLSNKEKKISENESKNEENLIENKNAKEIDNKKDEKNIPSTNFESTEDASSVSHLGRRQGSRKLYKCPKCSENFAMKCNLNRHLRHKNCGKFGKRRKLRKKNEKANLIDSSTDDEQFDDLWKMRETRKWLKTSSKYHNNHNLRKSKKLYEIVDDSNSVENIDEDFASKDQNLNVTVDKNEYKDGGEERSQSRVSHEIFDRSEKESNNHTDKESDQASRTLQDASLNTHGAVNKQFHCTKCEYTTSSLSHLNVHESMHSGLKPYRCSKCNFGSKYKSKYIQHKRSKTCCNSYNSEENDKEIVDPSNSDASFSDETNHNSNKEVFLRRGCTLKATSVNSDRLKEMVKSVEEQQKQRTLRADNNSEKYTKEHNLLEVNENSNSSYTAAGKRLSDVIDEDFSYDENSSVNTADEIFQEPVLRTKKRRKTLSFLGSLTENESDTDSSNNLIESEVDHSTRRFSRSIRNKPSTSHKNDKIKINLAGSVEIIERSEKEQSVSLNAKTPQQDNNFKSNEEERGGCNYDSNLDETLNSNQLREKEDNALLFKFFLADSENKYEDDVIFQMLFQNCKVLVQKLKVHNCTKCDFVSQSIRRLRIHKFETHFKPKKFYCSECSYSAVTRRALMSHEETHKTNEGEKISVPTEEKTSDFERIVEEEVLKKNFENETSEESQDESEAGFSISSTSVLDEDKYGDSWASPASWENKQMNKDNAQNVPSDNFYDGIPSQFAEISYSNKEVENLDLNYIQDHIYKIVNNKVSLILGDILGTEFKEKIMEKFDLESLEKNSQNEQKIDKPVDKTSYEYLSKALELYKESLSDSDDIDSDSSESIEKDKLLTPEDNLNVSQEVLRELKNYLNFKFINDDDKKSENIDNLNPQKMNNTETVDHITPHVKGGKIRDSFTQETSSGLKFSNVSDVSEINNQYSKVDEVSTEASSRSSILDVNNAQKKKTYRKSFFSYNSFSLESVKKYNVIELQCDNDLRSNTTDKKSVCCDDEIMIVDEKRGISDLPLHSKRFTYNDYNPQLRRVTTRDKINSLQEPIISEHTSSHLYKTCENIHLPHSKQPPVKELHPVAESRCKISIPRNLHKPNIRSESTTISHSNANLNMGNHLKPNNCSDRQVLPMQSSNISFLPNANEFVAFNSDSNIVVVPGNMNINVQVTPSPSIIYSHRELPEAPCLTGTSEDANNFYSKFPDATKRNLLLNKIQNDWFSHDSKVEVFNDKVKKLDGETCGNNTLENRLGNLVQPKVSETIILREESEFFPLQGGSSETNAYTRLTPKSTISDFAGQSINSKGVISQEECSSRLVMSSPTKNVRILSPLNSKMNSDPSEIKDGIQYQCSVCHLTFSEFVISQHLVEDHKLNILYKCEKCSYTSHHFSFVKKHLLSHMNNS